MSRLSGQHIPRATVRGAINSLPEGDNLFRLGRSSPVPGRMTTALRQGLMSAGERKAPAWLRLQQAGPPRGAMATASTGTSQGGGKWPSGLSLFQWGVLLLLLKLCQKADAKAAGWLWAAPPGLVPVYHSTQPYSHLPATVPARLVL